MKLNLIASTIAVGFVSTVIAMETNKDNLDGVTKAHILKYLPESTPASSPPKAMLVNASNQSVAPAAISVTKQLNASTGAAKPSDVDVKKAVLEMETKAPKVTPVVAEEKTADSTAAVTNTQKAKAQKVKNKGKKGKGKKGRKKKA